MGAVWEMSTDPSVERFAEWVRIFRSTSGR